MRKNNYFFLGAFFFFLPEVGLLSGIGVGIEIKGGAAVTRIA
jgi:hypothetical protein